MPVQSGLARFKVVIAATRNNVQLYPSIESLPKRQQKAARVALEGDLAATLLIADRKGLDRMKELVGRSQAKFQPVHTPLSVAKQLGLAFIAAGTLLTAMLLWAWFR